MFRKEHSPTAIYRPRKLRPWAITTAALRGLIRLLEFWPAFLILAFFLSPVGPHLRIQYRYFERGTEKIMIDCDYMGSRGLIKYMVGTRCPVITIIDTRPRPQ